MRGRCVAQRHPTGRRFGDDPSGIRPRAEDGEEAEAVLIARHELRSTVDPMGLDGADRTWDVVARDSRSAKTQISRVVRRHHEW